MRLSARFIFLLFASVLTVGDDDDGDGDDAAAMADCDAPLSLIGRMGRGVDMAPAYSKEGEGSKVEWRQAAHYCQPKSPFENWQTLQYCGGNGDELTNQRRDLSVCHKNNV